MGDKDQEGKTYGNIGQAYQGLGDFKTAIDYHERHLKIVEEVGNKGGEGKAYGRLGNCYWGLGDFKKATDYHERHLKIAKEVGDKDEEGKTYGNLGNVYHRLGDFKTAIDYHERHLKIAREVGDKDEEGRAYGNLGNAYQRLGDWKTAIDYHERHLKIAKEVGNKVGEGKAYGSFGNAYQGLGDFKTAIDYYDRCLKIAQEVGDKDGEGNTYCNLGNAYQSLWDLKTAIDYHERHLKISKEVGNKVGEGKAYGNLGNAYQGLGDFKTAIDYYKRHLKSAKEVGCKDGEGINYGNIGNAYQGLGDFNTAIDYHERSLKVAKEVGDKGGVAISFQNLGKSFELAEFLPKALDCFHASVTTFNIIRHDLKGKDEWKISYRNMYQCAYTSLWRLLLKNGKVAEALFAADQGRAQALNDLLELNYGLETSYSQLHTRKESTYDSFSFLPSTAVFIAIDKQDIVFWIAQDGYDVQLRKKKVSDNDSKHLKDVLESLLETASQEIDVRAGIKCEDRSLDKSGDEQLVRRSPQTPADFEHSSVTLQKSVLRTLYDVIIEPIADLVHGDELIIVPEGSLCLAPYAAFVDSNSRRLCEFCRVRVIPSLASLKLISDSADGYHNKTGVLLVGDPWVQEIVIPGEKLKQLPWARKEVQMIGRIFNTKPLILEEATKDEVLRRLPSVALIHIAAHGSMQTGEIALAPNTTRASKIPEDEDFLLTMKEVTSAQIRARLVVLSCCHSGRGEIKAEGVVGIARAFLGAGARAVLVSQWAIADKATLEFMRSFYSHLVKGVSASESLNKAMKHMRESDEFNEVKHWAPFLLIGDDVTIDFGGN